MYPELTRAEWDLKYFKARSAKAKVDACLERIYTSDAELKAKDEAYAKLQQAYDNLTAQYQKDVNELKAKLEPKTCDGCEYEGDKVGMFCYAFHTTCSREPTSDHFTPYKFFRNGE